MPLLEESDDAGGRYILFIGVRMLCLRGVLLESGISSVFIVFWSSYAVSKKKEIFERWWPCAFQVGKPPPDTVNKRISKPPSLMSPYILV